MDEIKEKKYVSTGELIALQLWIYYPIVIFAGLFYHPNPQTYKAIENSLLKLIGMHFDGAIVYLLMVVFLTNMFTITLVFRILLRPSKYTYGGKNGWYSVWWNFGVQTGIFVFMLSCLTIVFRLWAMKNAFDGIVPFLLPWFITFFLSTISYYGFIKMVSNILRRI